ncbi:MAG: hypothetical protein V4563_14990 [Pseudomonadota bacterium]
MNSDIRMMNTEDQQDLKDHQSDDERLLAARTGSAENIRLPNETKIKFCNALDALRRHWPFCTVCAAYVDYGDGDLCEKGKDIIARILCYADTSIEFPPNDRT